MTSPERLQLIFHELAPVICAVLKPSTIAEDKIRPQYNAWLNGGNSGAIAYIDSKIDTVCSPFTTRPWAKSAIVMAFLPEYLNASPLMQLPLATAESMHATIAAYAVMEDYHITGRRLLEQLSSHLKEEFGEHDSEACVDARPVPEKFMAYSAGLGTYGPNAMLRINTLGCSANLAVLFTSLDLPEIILQKQHIAPCASCRKCVTQCPTGAISGGRIAVRSCRSWIAGEKSGPLSLAEQLALQGTLYGCSCCSRQCPENTLHAGDLSVNPLEILKMQSSGLRAIIHGTPMEHIGTTKLKRNALAAIAFQHDSAQRNEIRETLRQYCSSETLMQTLDAW